MIDHGMDPQAALDAARFCIGTGHQSCGGQVSLEEGISQETATQLKALGHNVAWPVTGYERALFGRGQIICPRPVQSGDEMANVWWAGSDGRADGMAIGF